MGAQMTTAMNWSGLSVMPCGVAQGLMRGARLAAMQVALIVVASGSLVGCDDGGGSSIDDDDSDDNAPATLEEGDACERSSECVDDLVCVEGECAKPAAADDDDDDDVDDDDGDDDDVSGDTDDSGSETGGETGGETGDETDGETGGETGEETDGETGGPVCPAAKDCEGLECGDDRVCGVSCGTCSDDELCTEGKCEAKPPECPADQDCSALECGDDPVCGVSCGDCKFIPPSVCKDGFTRTVYLATGVCNQGVCEFGQREDRNCPFGCVDGACAACVPDCTGLECGDDGCGGSCGMCDKAPPATCSGASRVFYSASGSCSFGACAYTANTQGCGATGCTAGVCNPPECGDGVREGTEVCDKGTTSCTGLSSTVYESGTATCKADCTGYDTAPCTTRLGWSSVAFSTTPSGRSAHMMAYDAERDEVVLFGGIQNLNAGGPYNLLNDTWVFNGTAWQQRSPATSPTPRWDAGIAYDSVRKKVVMFGGVTSAPGSLATSNETWEWDGTNWTLMTPTTSPTSRSGVGMAYLPSRGLVMFGGIQHPGGSRLNTTWTYDGTTWTQKTPATNPTARYGAQMVARTTTMLIFGGNDGVSGGNGQSYNWSGTDWALLSTSTTLQRFNHALFRHGERGRTFAFGGEQSSVLTSNVLLEFGSTTWSTSPNPSLSGTAPTARTRPMAVYDAKRAQVVLFGGALSSGEDASAATFFLK